MSEVKNNVETIASSEERIATDQCDCRRRPKIPEQNWKDYSKGEKVRFWCNWCGRFLEYENQKLVSATLPPPPIRFTYTPY